MDRRFLTVLGVSLLFALVVASIFYRLTQPSGPAPRASTEGRDVVVALKPLPIGTTIKAADVTIRRIPLEGAPKAGSFTKVDEVLDRAVTNAILADEPLLEGRLAVRGSGIGISTIIPPGMRAVTVRVSDITSVAGFVLPGLRVDILITGRAPNAEYTGTRTVLQNMLVLSSGQQVQADQRGTAINAASVTLLATPEQAELLTLANTGGGSINLILRNGSDFAEVKTSGKDLPQLYGATVKKARSDDDAPRRRPRQQVTMAPVSPVVVTPPPPPPPPEVINIRGTAKSVEVVGGAR